VFKLKLAVVAAAAAFVALTSTSVAQAAYEDATVNINLNASAVIGGNSVSGTVTADGAPCAWTAVFDGQTRTGSGTSFSFSFTTPVVTVKTTKTLTVTCQYDDGNTGPASTTVTKSDGVQNASYAISSAAVTPAAIQTISSSVDVTILPQASGGNGTSGTSGSTGNGALPNTGGPHGALIGGGVALLLVGAGVMFIARRKGTQAV